MSERVPRYQIVVFGILISAFSIFAYWTINLFSEDIIHPAELCISNKFPGKSAIIGRAGPADLSIFNDPEFSMWKNDKYYSDFNEDRIHKESVGAAKDRVDTRMPDETYRFSWFRSFHKPMIFRAYRIGEDKYLVAKELGRDGLTIDKTSKINNREWCEFISRLDEADFWNMEKIDVRSLAHDGAFWVMEGSREERYYVAGQQSPAGGDFRDACIYLMKLSGIRIEEDSPEFY